MFSTYLKKIIILLFATMLVGCANNLQNAQTTKSADDPIESINRVSWKINSEYLDPYVLRPVSLFWYKNVPNPVKTVLTNVTNNLDEPISVVSRLLEGNIEKALIHFTRFWINSIFGIAGLIDWASSLPGLESEGARDFGYTLGYYGIPKGAYLMLPALGPTTVRQLIGTGLGSAFNYLLVGASPWLLVKTVIQSIKTRADLIQKENILTNSVDQYIAVREAYLSNLQFQITNEIDNTENEQLSAQDLEEIDN